MSDVSNFEPWERIQIKTFTKWCNNHLSKRWGKEHAIADILADWESGIPLMRLAVSLYESNEEHPEQAISMPKLKKNMIAAKSRIQKVNNGDNAIKLIKAAGVKLRGVSAENLVDHDKISILGMVWILILDYAARGFGGTAAEVKRALLEWVNKKTDGYEKVNPPKVKNFTKDWRSGLAWCALIHKHRPEALDYQQCLGQSNAENLELAFGLAEEIWNIPRLLDVEDVDTDSPDDKSIMTYVMEYFLAMAGDGLKEAAAAQAAEWLKFLRELRERMNGYEKRARALMANVSGAENVWRDYDFGSTKEEGVTAFNDLREFVGTEKPIMECEKMDLESFFAEIQTQLLVNNLAPYTPPKDISPEAIQEEFLALSNKQLAHSKAVRENKFSFVEAKEDTTSEETIKQIKTAFDRYDANSNGFLNPTEFQAACMEMGIVLRTEEEKVALYNEVSKSNSEVGFEEYKDWMESKLKVSMNDAASAKAAFRAIADDQPAISEAQLKTNPLTDEDRAFLRNNMVKNDEGRYDYDSFVDQMMVGGGGMKGNTQKMGMFAELKRKASSKPVPLQAGEEPEDAGEEPEPIEEGEEE